jgi:hypothetical protein
MNHNNQHITETCYQPFEIVIQGAGKEVKIEQALPLLYDKVEGVTILHPGGNHGKGTLELSVAGEEIFPKGFHARAFMIMQSSHHTDAIINREIDNYLYEFEERAKGSTIYAKYTEPINGESGVVYLIFKLTRQKPCG